MTYFTGTSADDTIVGTGNNDTIRGLSGNDRLEGLGGADSLQGEGGSDTLIGGADDDFLTAHVGGVDVFDGGDGRDDFHFFFDRFSDETVVADSVVRVSGGGGNDRVRMELQKLSNARVEIDAGDGADLIAIGGYLPAIVTLGAGQDVIQLVAFYGQYFVADTGPMVVTDFQPGAGGDRIEWNAFFTANALDYDGSNPFATGKARLIQDGADTIVQVDVDGAGTWHGFTDYFRLEGVSRAQLTDANFGGHAPGGAFPTGTTFIDTGGVDSFFGWAGDDRIEGRGGNDWIPASFGDDLVLGGDGNDSLYGQHGDDRLEGGAGDDEIHGDDGNDVMLGGYGNDKLLEGGDGADHLDGGPGADVLNLSRSHDAAAVTTSKLLGGADGDHLVLHVFNLSTAVIDGGTGDDDVNVYGLRGTLDVTLGAGSDVLQLNKGYNPLGFDEGRITVRDFDVAAGGDRVTMDSYFMSLFPGWDGVASPFEAGLFRLVQTGADTFWEVDWADDEAGFLPLIKFQGVAASQLSATHLAGFAPGPIHFFGTAQADVIVGGAKGDVIDGGAGADSMTGHGGNDSYRVDNAGDQVIEAAGGGVDSVESRIDYILPAEVEHLTLTGSAADATGNALANTLIGNMAANRLDGRGGGDRMEGGIGDDVYIVDHYADRIVELATQGVDSVRSSASHTLADHVEHLTLTGGAHVSGNGNALANTITGNSGNNRLDGKAGADMLAGGGGHDVYVVNYAADKVIEAGNSGTDTIESSVSYALPTHVEKLILTGSLGYDGRGNAGANTIVGNSGGNFLNGGSGNDVIDGGAGNDRLLGALGNDSLKGGAGSDRFEFITAPGAANADKILDFSAADDALYLMRSVFAAAGPNGTLAASAFHQGTSAADAGDRILYDAVTGNIFYDSDGNGAAAAMLFATVSAGTPLSHADFMIYG